MAVEFPLVGPGYANESRPTNEQELINMFINSGGPGGKDHLERTPGLELYKTVSAASISELFEYDGKLHVIGDETLWSIDSAGTITNIGTITGSIKPSVAKYITSAAVEEVTIVRGGNGYVLSGSTLTAITDADFPATANYVTSIKNVSVIAADANKFHASDVGTGLTYTGTWLERVTDIGDVVAVLNDHDEVFVMGETGIQVYDYSPSGTAFPFVERVGAKIEISCLSRDSIAQVDNSFMFFGKSKNGVGRVWRIQGYQPLNITNAAIEREIASYGTISDATAFSYYQAGHEFYVLTFPTQGVTWVYDASIGDPNIAWHKRETYQKGRWRGNCHAVIDGVHYVGDYDSGNIYKMKLDVYDDNSQPMIAKRILPHYPAGWYSYLKIGVNSGVGLVTGQGSDPQLMLRWSNDGGYTYSPLKTRSFGERGEFDTLVEFHGLGFSRKQRTFEITCSDPVPFTLYSAELGFDPYGK